MWKCNSSQTPISTLLLLALLCLAVGCARQEPEFASQEFSGEYPFTAVATVGMVADVVRNVGGDYVNVIQICGAGVDPHLYSPSRDDVAKIKSADIVFYNGLLLEGKMTETLMSVSRRKPVFAVSDSIDRRHLMQGDTISDHFDPHVWMDVSLWSETIETVEMALAGYDPTNADLYQRNADQYRARLAELHQYGLDALGTIPEPRRILVTSHDAFNYFGNAYRIRVEGVQGLSTESEAGVQRINELVDLLVRKEVGAVFIESSVPRKNIEALIEGAAAKGHEVTIGGELYSDAMGEQGTYEGTYEGMLDHNFTVVTRALGGEAAQTGLRGKLTRAEQ